MIIYSKSLIFFKRLLFLTQNPAKNYFFSVAVFGHFNILEKIIFKTSQY